MVSGPGIQKRKDERSPKFEQRNHKDKLAVLLKIVSASPVPVMVRTTCWFLWAPLSTASFQAFSAGLAVSRDYAGLAQLLDQIQRANSWALPNHQGTPVMYGMSKDCSLNSS